MFSQIKKRIKKEKCPKFNDIKTKATNHIWEREEYGRFNNPLPELYDRFGCQECSIFYRKAVYCPRNKKE